MQPLQLPVKENIVNVGPDNVIVEHTTVASALRIFTLKSTPKKWEHISVLSTLQDIL